MHTLRCSAYGPLRRRDVLLPTGRKEETMTKRIRLPALAIDNGKVRLGAIINPLPRTVADNGKVRLGAIAPIV